jgi:hypothetical protein
MDWTCKPEQAATDFEEDDSARDKQPLEYTFEVEINGIKPDEPSLALWLTRPLEIVIESEDPKDPPTPDGTIVKLKMANHRCLYAETKNQKVTFDAVIIGPILALEIMKQTHRVV